MDEQNWDSKRLKFHVNDSHTFKSSEVQYLFRDGDDRYVVMESDTYEQHELKAIHFGPAFKFLKEGLEGIKVTWWEGFLIGVQIPDMVQLQVASITHEYDESGGIGEPFATLETGAVVRVYLETKIGDTLTIDTRSEKVVSRGHRES